MCIYCVFTNLCSFSVTAQKENNILVDDGLMVFKNSVKASEML